MTVRGTTVMPRSSTRSGARSAVESVTTATRFWLMGGSTITQRAQLLSGSSAGRGGAAPAARLVGQVGQVEAVHEVPEHGQTVLVQLVGRRRLLLVLLGDHTRPLQHLRGDEDRAFEADRERDGVAGP